MRKKKIVVLLGSVCLALMMIAMACAGPAPSPTPSPSPTPTPSTTPGPTPAAEVIKWKLQQSWGSAETWLFDPFVQRLEELTDGRMVIDGVYCYDGLVPEAEALEALRAGTLNLAHAWGDLWADEIPVGRVEAMIMQFAEQVQRTWVLYDDRVDYEGVPFGFGVEQALRDEYAKHGIYYICTWMCDESTFFLREPFESIFDLKGRKVWATVPQAKVLEPTGIVSSLVPPEELYSSLATGIVDAVSWGACACAWDMGFHEVCKYVWKPSFSPLITQHLITSVEQWNALPDDLKACVEAAAAYGSQHTRTNFIYREMARQKAMQEDFGVEVCWVSPEEQKWLLDRKVEILKEYMKVDEASRDVGQKILDWLKFYGRID